MENLKGVLKSKTIWGGIIAVAAGILGSLGYAVGAEDQAAIIDTVTSVAGAVGGAVAIYGRIKATKKIG